MKASYQSINAEVCRSIGSHISSDINPEVDKVAFFLRGLLFLPLTHSSSHQGKLVSSSSYAVKPVQDIGISVNYRVQQCFHVEEM